MAVDTCDHTAEHWYSFLRFQLQGNNLEHDIPEKSVYTASASDCSRYYGAYEPNQKKKLINKVKKPWEGFLGSASHGYFIMIA